MATTCMMRSSRYSCSRGHHVLRLLSYYLWCACSIVCYCWFEQKIGPILVSFVYCLELAIWKVGFTCELYNEVVYLLVIKKLHDLCLLINWWLWPEKKKKKVWLSDTQSSFGWVKTSLYICNYGKYILIILVCRCKHKNCIINFGNYWGTCIHEKTT